MQEQGLSQGAVGSSQNCDWEDSGGQELSEEEDCIGQELSQGNGSRASVQSGWEDDSDQEFAQHIGNT